MEKLENGKNLILVKKGQKIKNHFSPKLFIFRDREYAQSIDHKNAQNSPYRKFLKKRFIIFFGPFTKKKFQKKYKSHKKSLDRSMTPILNGFAIKYRPC